MTTELGQADVFISHAHEDKEVARPLAEALRQRGLTVWYDEYVLRLGDSLREVIERGLASARFGVVILSPNFFAKEWPQRELNALLARETTKRSKVLLPIWHNLTLEEVTTRTPIIADRLAVSTAKGIPFIVEQILAVLEAEKPRSAATASPPPPPIRRAESPEQTAPVRAAQRTGPNETRSGLGPPAIVALIAAALLVAGVLLWRLWRPSSVPFRLRGTPVTSIGTSTQPAQQGLKACVPGEEQRSEDGIDFVRICPGIFSIGSAENDPQAAEAEKPAHQVTLSEFWLGKTEITNEQYRRFQPNHQGEANLPVTNVSWTEAQAACESFGGRLPTEAEWEYAARAGSQTAWSFGDDEKMLGEYAWYGEGWDGTPHPVRTKKANAWGLHDMYGNVWEWVADRYGPYASVAQTDPPGAAKGEGDARVLRGGSFFNAPWSLRSAIRVWGEPQDRIRDIGFRCARGPRRSP
jgi:formylglycine-generating enzyme required for sulfatase activity